MPPVALKRIRLAYIAASYLTFVFVTIRASTGCKEGASDVLFGAALAIFVTMACVADSAVLGHPIAFGVRLPFAITWPAALPVYVLCSRGWWGIIILLATLGILIGTAIGCAVIEVTATILMK
jgi:hypothetical protein